MIVLYLCHFMNSPGGSASRHEHCTNRLQMNTNHLIVRAELIQTNMTIVELQSCLVRFWPELCWNLTIHQKNVHF